RDRVGGGTAKCVNDRRIDWLIAYEDDARRRQPRTLAVQRGIRIGELGENGELSALPGHQASDRPGCLRVGGRIFELFDRYVSRTRIDATMIQGAIDAIPASFGLAVLISRRESLQRYGSEPILA